jgi:hypothetical protein
MLQHRSRITRLTARQGDENGGEQQDREGESRRATGHARSGQLQIAGVDRSPIPHRPFPNTGTSFFSGSVMVFHSVVSESDLHSREEDTLVFAIATAPRAAVEAGLFVVKHDLDIPVQVSVQAYAPGPRTDCTFHESIRGALSCDQ